jgi:zinc-ribbon domain
MASSACSNCGASVSASSRFCPECGRPLTPDAASPATAVYDAPRRRLWPPDPLVLAAVLIAAGGIILLLGGLWAWGLAALLLAGLVFLSQREVERRAARATLASLRERLTARRDVWTARSRGQLDLFRARRELAELLAERGRAYHDLGRAVFDEDETGREAAKAALDGLVERIKAKESEIQILAEQIEERVRRAQSGVQPTEKMEQPPAPVPVPEPSPTDPPPEPEHPPTPRSKRRRKKA